MEARGDAGFFVCLNCDLFDLCEDCDECAFLLKDNFIGIYFLAVGELEVVDAFGVG